MAYEDQEGLRYNNDIAANSFGIHKQIIPEKINSLKVNFFGVRYCVIKVKNIFYDKGRFIENLHKLFFILTNIWKMVSS